MSMLPAAARAAPAGERSFSCFAPNAASAAPPIADAQRSAPATFTVEFIDVYSVRVTMFIKRAGGGSGRVFRSPHFSTRGREGFFRANLRARSIEITTT